MIGLYYNRDVCQKYSDLLTTCIDTWSELTMDIDLATEVCV